MFLFFYYNYILFLDFFKRFANQIIDKTIKFDGNKKKQKIREDFKNEEIEEIIKKEIKNLRLDAVKALYNAISKNQKHLTKERINKITKCLSDKDPEFVRELQKITEIDEFSKDMDYKSVFDTYMQQLYEKDTENIDLKIRFLSRQSRDEAKCKELFNDEKIKKLIEIYKFLDNQDFLEIINNYLRYEYSRALNDELLEALIELSTKNNKVFFTILLSVDKSKTITELLVQKLISNSNSCNFIVFILSRTKQTRSEKELEYLSSNLMSNDCVVYDVNSKIEFKPLDQDNSDYAVSLLSSKLILEAIIEKISLNETIIDNLIVAVEESKDKQTRICCAKCIYKISQCKIPPFKNEHLNKMYNLIIEDPVYDVRVYMHSAYCRSVALLAKANKRQVKNEDVQNVSGLFLLDDFNLGNKNLKMEINGSILLVLKCAIGKEEFGDEIFKLCEWILFYSEDNYKNRVIQILEAYTSKHHNIPLTTIEALENVLNDCPSALLTLKNVIYNGQPVGVKTLERFLDKFYISNKTDVRRFEIMERARKNQELPDKIFFKLELIKAAFGLTMPNIKIKCILDFIKDLITRERSFSLPFVLIDALIRLLKRNECVEVVIEIFENSAKNNQPLPDSVFDEMENQFEKGQLKEKILSIFVELRPEKLSESLIKKLIAKLKVDIVGQYLNALLLCFEKSKESIGKYSKDLESIIENGLSLIDDFYIHEVCIRLLKLGVEISNEESISNKLDKILNNCPEHLTKLIESYFCQKVSYVNDTIKLKKLEWKSNKQYLDDVFQLRKNGGTLGENNFIRLKTINDKEQNKELIKQIFDILGTVKEGLPDDLIDSLAKWMGKDNAVLRLRCRIFLKSLKTSGKTFSEETEEIYKKMTEGDKRDGPFLELISEFQFDEKTNEALIEFLKKIKSIGEPQNLEELLDKMIENNEMSFLENAQFCRLIKSYLKKDSSSKSALQFYARVLKVSTTEESILNELSLNCNNLELLVECIYNAIENKKITVPQSCFELIKKLIENQDSTIRLYSFKGLRSACSSRLFKFNLEKCCNEKLKAVLVNHRSVYDKIMKQIPNRESFYDLLEVIWSLNYIDVGVFKINESALWRRELIVSQLFQEFNPEKEEKKLFYKYLLKIENKSVDELLSYLLQKKSFFKKFNDIIDTLVHVSHLKVDWIKINNSFNPFKSLKIDWCEWIMKKKLNVESENLRSTCEELAKLDTNFIAKLFESITIVEDLQHLKELIKFCFEKKTTARDLVFGKRGINELTRLLTIKDICSCLPAENKTEIFKLYRILSSLLEKKWITEELRKIIESIKKIDFGNPLKNCIDLLSIFEQFNLPSQSFKELESILDKKNLSESLKELNRLAVKKRFQNKTKKSEDELLKEFEDLNPSKFHDLKAQLDKVNQFVDKITNVKELVNNMKEFNLCEAIAAIKKAIHSDKGIKINDTQIICSLAAYQFPSLLKINVTLMLH